MDKKALIELVKSFARFIWFGLIGLVVTFLGTLVTSGQLNDINVVFNGMEINLSFVILAIITGIVKLLDKYVHEANTIEANGIAPSFLQK